MAQLKTARTLGISLKRFLGWQPTEEDPVEWDETEREWMLALDRYETTILCPVCGMPSEFCHDEKKVQEAFSRGAVDTCYVSAMREKAVQKFNSSGRVEAPNSQTTRLIPREN